MPADLIWLFQQNPIRILILIGSVIAFAFGIAYNKSESGRDFVIMLCIGLILVSNLAVVNLAPGVQFQKYGGMVPDEQQYYEVYYIDESGDRVKVDWFAAFPLNLHTLGHQLRNTESESAKREMVRPVVDRANDYKDSVGTPLWYIDNIVSYSHPGNTDAWQREEISQYGDFVGIQVNSQIVTYKENPDGLDRRVVNETKVAEVYVNESVEERLTDDSDDPTNESDTK